MVVAARPDRFVVLIVFSATLLSATLVRLLTQDAGFQLSGTVFLDTDFPFVYGRDAGPRVAAELEQYRVILDRLNHTPGIRSASLDLIHVLAGGAYMEGFAATPPTEETLRSQTIMNTIAPRYFAALGTRMLAGPTTWSVVLW